MSGGKGLRAVADALAQLLGSVEPLAACERVALGAASGRILADDVLAPCDVPPQDNSAMDGYCVAAADVPAGGGWFAVSQRIPAGLAPVPLAPGSCARIFTGATLPAGADAVIMQEDVRIEAERVWLPAVKSGDNVRPAGQDVRRDSVVVTAGTRLAPVHLGLLASVGIAAVGVIRRLRVALLSTGNELVEPGRPLGVAQIYNSNRYLLAGLLSELGCEVIDLGTVPDDPAATERVLRDAARADAILSSGGVSVGEEDHVRVAIERLGEVSMWKLAIKPGKPFAFGQVLGTPYIALPGNPASVLVTFQILARPWLILRQGGRYEAPMQVRLPAAFQRIKPGNRQDYLRARADVCDGVMSVRVHPHQSSGMLSSACWANGFAVIAPGQTVEEGDLVDFLPFTSLLR